MKAVLLNGDNVNPDGDLSWSSFYDYFDNFILYGNTSLEELPDRIRDADIILYPDAHMNEEVLRHAEKLKYIGAFATGINFIDLDYCRKRGITVTNIPGYSTQMVSQYAIALLLEVCCQVGHHNKVIHEGKWMASGRHMFWDYPIIELSGKTAGIIGFGNIGRQSAKTLQALGMKVLYSDVKRAESEESQNCQFAEKEEIFAKSDVIFLHCPLVPETRGLIDRPAIAAMKDGVILINNARGPLIDSAALAEALKSGKVYAAGLDVTDPEPLPIDSPLISSPNCFITPHISWAAKESRERLVNMAFENVKAYLEGRPQNVVV